MSIKNFECKAKVDNINEKEKLLSKLNPLFIGEDHQVDTYFNVATGRLKLREGNIENALIYYERENIADSKLSTILLYQHNPDIALKQILIKTLGVKAVVDKQRKIYYIDNVKFHFDIVENLGSFIEIEAIDLSEEISVEQLKDQCDHYIKVLDIDKEKLIAISYSDLIIEQNKN